MCFDHFSCCGLLAKKGVQNSSLQQLLVFFLFSGGVLQLGYVKPQGLGCVGNAGTCCASLLAPDFLYMSICTLDTDVCL